MFQQPTAESDDQAWNLLRDTEHRWIFNKLEVALRQGLHAGPAATPPQHENWYITRPVYNIYGMGIGAERFHYTHEMRDDIINHALIPPGYFWCEWISGPHISTDYMKTIEGEWLPVAAWEGVHYNDDNLVKFKHWFHLPNNAAPALPEWFTFLNDITALNVETRNGKVIEIHARLGDMPTVPIGYKLVPIWERGVTAHIPDCDPDMAATKAHGHLTSIRNGYRIEL